MGKLSTGYTRVLTALQSRPAALVGLVALLSLAALYGGALRGVETMGRKESPRPALEVRLFGLTLATLPATSHRFIRPEIGLSATYPVVVPESLALVLWPGQDHASSQTSRTVVREDGRALSQPHAHHRAIRNEGRGRFSHWGQKGSARSVVLFSASDDSNPADNDRRYEIEYRLVHRPWLSLFFVPAGLPLAVVILSQLRGLVSGVKVLGLGRSLALPVLLPLCAAVAVAAQDPLSKLLVCVGSAIVLTLVRWRWPPEAPKTLGKRARIALVALVVVGSSASSLYFVNRLSTPIAPDTATYWSSIDQLLAPAQVPTRTPLYSFLFALFSGLGLPGTALIAFQAAVRSFGAALVTWFASGRSLGATLAIGLLLALDPVGAAMSCMYLTESLSSQALLVSAVVLLYVLRGSCWSWQRYVAAGVLFGIAALFRPSGAPLLFLPPLLALLISRSTRKALWVGTGSALVLALIVGISFVRTGQPAVVSGGYFLAFPLFIQKLFAPENGPASARIDEGLAACGLEGKINQVVLANANSLILSEFGRCLASIYHDKSIIDELYSRSYVEAVRARPLWYLRQVSLESLRFLGLPVSDYPRQVLARVERVNLDELCRRHPPYNSYQPALIAFVCPMPRPLENSAPDVQAVGFATKSVYQPYLYPHLGAFYRKSFARPAEPTLAGMTSLPFFLLALIVVPRSLFGLVLAAIACCLYNAAVTAAAQVTILRYVALVSPFMLVITGAFFGTLLDDVARVVRSLTRHVRKD